MLSDVVFVHGDLQNHTVFNNIRKFFEDRGHKCFSFDLPGHGNEEKIINPIEFLEDKINSDKPIVVAHSSGAAMALKYFEKTKNCSGFFFVSPLLINPIKFVKGDPEEVKKLHLGLSASKFLKQELVDYSIPMSEEEINKAGLRTTSPRGFENNFNFYTSIDFDFDFDLRVVIVAPEKDHAIPFEVYEKMSGAVKNCVLERIDSGHNPLITNPKEIEGILAKNYSFLTE